MTPAAWDAADLAKRVREEVQRLAAVDSDAARWAVETWWLRRLVVITSAQPAAMQHALAAGVVASIPRARLEAHLRAGPPRRDDAA